MHGRAQTEDQIMTVQIAEALLLQTGVRIAYQHRFAFDTGTVLRLDNYTMVNIFDDGRYYLQGDNTEEVAEVFRRTETPWDPTDWNGEKPGPKQVIDVKSEAEPMRDPRLGNSDERMDF